MRHGTLLFTLLCLLPPGTSYAAPGAAGTANLAIQGTAKSWLPSSVATYPIASINDGDALTCWASEQPTLDPPKDCGIEWPNPVKLGAVRVRFYSLWYAPARDGWELEALVGNKWQKLQPTTADIDSEWWTLRFAPVTAKAVRLVVNKYAAYRPAVAEFEAYETGPPAEKLRRKPLLDGAFWAFNYVHWAKHYETDEALAAEAVSAHGIGLDTIILCTTAFSDGAYTCAVPATVMPQAQWWAGRDPVEAILTEADRLKMQVYLGDSEPNGFLGKPDREREPALKKFLNQYRQQLIERYRDHPSFVGYYINYAVSPEAFSNDSGLPAREAEELAAYVKRLCPRLKVIQPIVLHPWKDTPAGPARPVSPVELTPFWEPWIRSATNIDIYLVFDGGGSGLSTLVYSDLCQGCIRALCEAAGKQMWTDVECVDYRTYTPLPVGRLAVSLGIAARHADRILTFCYLTYMSPTNGKPDALQLYQAYDNYRKSVR